MLGHSIANFVGMAKSGGTGVLMQVHTFRISCNIHRILPVHRSDGYCAMRNKWGHTSYMMYDTPNHHLI